MDVQLNYLGAGETPSNTFVSLRIGDIQKQARLAANRNFRFARVDSGDGKATLSKLEVFRRVGSAVVNLASIDAGTLRDIKVLCEDPTLGTMAFQLGLNGPGATTAAATSAAGPGPAAAPAAAGGKKTEMKQRKDAAQAYLNEHGLETVLAEAVRDVIAAKPIDPFGFLAQRFQRRSTGQHIPEPTKPAPAVPAPKPVEGSKEQKSAAPPPPPPPPQTQNQPGQQSTKPESSLPRGSSNEGRFRNGKPVQPEVQATGQTGQQEAGSRSSSRLSNFGLTKMPAIPKLDSLYKKFPAYMKACEASSAQGSVKNYSTLPSVASWHSPLSHKRNGAFQAEGKQAIVHPSNGFSLLPSVGTWLQPSPKALQASQTNKTSTTATSNFQVLPSVGTWLQPAPKAVTEASTPSPTTVAKVSGPGFAVLPSVGTWLLPPPKAPAATSTKTTTTAAATTPAAKAATTRAAANTKTYGVEPSVCSWFKPLKQTRRSAAAAAAKELGKKKFAFNPSVGSWLMTAPVVIP